MILIKITDKKGKCDVSTFAKPGREVIDDIHDIVGDAIGENGVPLDMEISSWAELASVGEVWENDIIRVEPVEKEF